MTIRCLVRYLMLLSIGWTAACEMSDGDRCAGGFVYNPDLKACSRIRDAAVPDPNAGVPSDDAAVSEAGPASSFGRACTTVADCKLDTNYCFALPGTAAGYCSKSNCNADCPSDYKCCTCATFGIVACLRSTDAIQSAVYGCTCF